MCCDVYVSMHTLKMSNSKGTGAFLREQKMSNGEMRAGKEVERVLGKGCGQ